ncbi:unnamed protein product [Arabidopsis halleri]
MGGKNLVHSCAMSRLVGYYLEPLLVLGLFEKKPLSIRLRGIFLESMQKLWSLNSKLVD